MKAKRVSVVAKGSLAKATVFSGRKQKTKSGLTKASLAKNKRGKVVSKKMSANGKKVYGRTIKAWADATKAAEGAGRQGLRSHGRQVCGGACALCEGQGAHGGMRAENGGRPRHVQCDGGRKIGLPLRVTRRVRPLLFGDAGGIRVHRVE